MESVLIKYKDCGSGSVNNVKVIYLQETIKVLCWRGLDISSFNELQVIIVRNDDNK